MHTEHLAVLISSGQGGINGGINSTEMLSPIGIIYIYQQSRSPDSPTSVSH